MFLHVLIGFECSCTKCIKVKAREISMLLLTFALEVFLLVHSQNASSGFPFSVGFQKDKNRKILHHGDERQQPDPAP